MPIVGDLKQVLTELNALVEPTTHEAWLEQIREWQAEYPMVIPESKNGVLHAQYVLSELNKIAKDDAIIVSDVGQHQMWAAQFLTHKNLILSLPLAVRVPWGMACQRLSVLK